MTQHPGQDDPAEGEDRNRGQTPGEPGGDADSPGHQPTTPLGGTPEDPRTPGPNPGQRPGQPGQGSNQPGQPGGPNQPGQGPYGRQTPPSPQIPGGGSGYGYGQQQSGYPAPGQNQPGQPRPGQGQPGQPRPGQGQPGPGGQQGPYSGQPYQQQYPQQQYPQSSGAPNKNVVEGKNFFAALFDLSFQSFVTVKFAKFIYVLLMAFIVLGYVFVVVASFADDAVVGLVALLLGWIPAAIYLILIRISLEFMIAMVRTSQNTAGTRTEIEALRSELKNRR